MFFFGWVKSQAFLIEETWAPSLNILMVEIVKILGEIGNKSGTNRGKGILSNPLSNILDISSGLNNIFTKGKEIRLTNDLEFGGLNEIFQAIDDKYVALVVSLIAKFEIVNVYLNCFLLIEQSDIDAIFVF